MTSVKFDINYDFLIFLISNGTKLNASRGYDWNAAFADIVLELDIYDMVYVWKKSDAASRELHNHFQGWLMP